MSHKIENMKTLIVGKYFDIVFDPSIDVIDNYLEGKPNYFIVNKNTGMVEGHAMSENIAADSIRMADDLIDGKGVELEGENIPEVNTKKHLN